MNFGAIVYLRKKIDSRALFLIFLGLPCASLSFAEEQCEKSTLETIVGDVILPKNCTFETGLVITQSNVNLDCNGSTFVGNDTHQTGLIIDSKGKNLENVSVKNCSFKGYKKHGVFIGWRGIDANKKGKHEEIYRKTPRNIKLESITVSDSGGVGVYFDDYTQNIELVNSVIKNSVGVGLYLEHSSRNHKIINNKIIYNGIHQPDGRGKREGVAVDSSANNLIEGNEFKSNGAGGIFLYKNCGEKIESNRQVIRWQHSNENIIKNNMFVDESVGIWLASRQYKDLRFMGCGDPMINADGWYKDFANHNVISNNRFCRVKDPVRDYGSGNIITSNGSAC